MTFTLDYRSLKKQERSLESFNDEEGNEKKD
jgi:hypothetical protein